MWTSGISHSNDYSLRPGVLYTPPVQTLSSRLAQAWSLAWEPGSHKPWGVGKREKQNKTKQKKQNNNKELLLLFSCSVTSHWVSHVSHSLQLHGLQHTRLPCPLLSPGVCLNSCILSWWCHPTISSSVTPFPSCPQSLPASGSFLVSQLFTSGGQSIGAPASASILPMNIQDWVPFIGWFDLLGVQGTLMNRLQHYNPKVSILQCSVFFMVQLSHPYMTTGKNIALTIWTFVAKWCLCLLIRYVCYKWKRSGCIETN